MARFFCTVEHKAQDIRLTLSVDAIDHTQAVVRAEDVYNDHHPRRVGEIRKLDSSAMRLDA